MYTHGHADHVGGSREFAARWESPVVVGHSNVAHRFDRYEHTNNWNLDINLRQFGGIRADLNLGLVTDDDDPASDFAPASSERRWRSFLPKGTLRPTLEVDDHHSMTIGAVDIEAHHARGETDDHLWFWLPSRRRSWPAISSSGISPMPATLRKSRDTQESGQRHSEQWQRWAPNSSFPPTDFPSPATNESNKC
jgi:glyoxylase-like metal-dependent hydrolase (beta-lactamase superfamily II)